MGHQIIKQPNGKYAVFSSIVDHFIMWDATPEAIIEDRVQEFREQTEKAVRETCRRLDEGDPKVYRQFTMTWDEAIKDIRERYGKDDETLAEFRAAGLIE